MQNLKFRKLYPHAIVTTCLFFFTPRCLFYIPTLTKVSFILLQVEGEGEVSPVRLEMPQAEPPRVLPVGEEAEQVEDTAMKVGPERTEAAPVVSHPALPKKMNDLD